MENGLFRSNTPQASYHSNSMPFKLDEGFSEAFPSQDENGQNISAAAEASFQEWVMAQDEEQRADIAYEVLRTLRTSTISAVVERLTPLLHMDPVQKLPAEITAEIFAYLDASTLLIASLASRTWRERILDSRLWKKLYKGQGWGFDLDEVRSFDNLSTSSSFRSKGKGRAHLLESSGNNGQPQHKKRATLGWLDHRTRKISADTNRWREQHDRIEADTDDVTGEDQEMQDAPPTDSDIPSPQRPNKRHSRESGDEMEVFSLQQHSRSDDRNIGMGLVELSPPLKPSLFWRGGLGTEGPNWSFLYKQRRRLEDNWNKGRFKNFQLPHPQYPHEAHTECVYTIQFYGKWLVSGSRDKSLRVWDLETKRLRGKPLVGHSQSVLCLQFDPTPEEDVIISGSSDTSVIVWRFSTGQKLHEIPQAHSESVLNLRFDSRFLVTCSKDKLIKVWNRKELLPTDPSYPRRSDQSQARIPVQIIDISAYTPTQLAEKIDFQQIKPLRAYSNLMILSGHAAAVNAIQIDKDQIVSASGDRHIKMWDVKDGRCLRTLQGHMKGIACVQFDSRRIVSGSSDNTVRIYDPATGAELATLQGHTNLVRTVQAGFGDLPGSEEEFDMQARAAERAYVEGVRNGTIIDEPTHRSRRRRSGANSSVAPGRSRVAFGASLPPGGGGSQWGRIVSGSYDESIIIWKKDANGDWVISQRLRQEAAVRAINDQARGAHPPPRPVTAPSLGAMAVNGAVNMPIPSSTQVIQQAMGASMNGLAAGIQNVMTVGNILGGPGASWNVPPSTGAAQNGNLPQQANGWLPPGAQQVMHQLSAHAQNVAQAQIHAQLQAQIAAATQQAHVGPQASPQQQQNTTNAHNATTTPPPGPQTVHQATTAQPPGQAQASNHQLNPQTLPHAPQANAHHPQPNQQQQQSVSRVFKLQFDARRIVCCSQDSRIVGWDFANGDAEIEEGSRFFLGP